MLALQAIYFLFTFSGFFQFFQGKLTQSDARVRVGSLQQLCALAADHPQGVGLRGAFRVQQNTLKLPEVCCPDILVQRTGIQRIWNTVVVKVVKASVSTTITCKREIKRQKTTVRFPGFIFSQERKNSLMFKCNEKVLNDGGWI